MSENAKWRVQKYLIGLPPDTQEMRTGLVYRELGLHQAYDDVWSLTHLNSGHRAFTLYGLLGDIVEAATAIAEAVDWSFKGLEGWKSDPDFLKKLEAATAKYPETVNRAVGENRSDTVAADIASLRSA
jgi:hypothetical protein